MFSILSWLVFLSFICYTWVQIWYKHNCIVNLNNNIQKILICYFFFQSGTLILSLLNVLNCNWLLTSELTVYICIFLSMYMWNVWLFLDYKVVWTISSIHHLFIFFWNGSLVDHLLLLFGYHMILSGNRVIVELLMVLSRLIWMLIVMQGKKPTRQS